MASSIDSLQRSLALYRELGDIEGQALGLANLGNSFHRLCDASGAIDYYEESLALFERMGSPADDPGVRAIREALADARRLMLAN